MNEDKQLVEVARLREAEAEIAALQKTLNSWRTMTCTWCGLTMPYTPEMHDEIEAKINEHALTCKYDPRNIEIKALRAQLDQAKPARDAAEVIDRLRAQLREAEAEIAALRERAEKAEADAERLAAVLLSVKEWDADLSYQTDYEDALYAALSAHDAEKDER